ncbi:putative oxidoreductase [Promicromonospora umidemergens]|uniref:DoxX family protein n=1 Tax=Promicromonospora umidemergens TaxID=629679 RepID=A0ABP8WWP7_9MICO|nr:DoxX family protein [Promicromonospora umidemergens]MCP2283644.1 putative oxidoreductase [Promicromonospora umidemergens]
MKFPWTKDLAVLVARVAIGAVLIAHGAQKFFTFGIAGTVDSFAGMGIPVPEVAALFAAVVELVGGAALILGAATPVVGLLVTLNMLGALVLVHLGNGVFVDQGGFELVAALGAGALVLAATGPGVWSVDHLVGRTLTARRAQATSAA